MLYPSDIEEKIGFIQVRGLIEGACLSQLGREEAKTLRFTDDYPEIIRCLQETEEFRQILLSRDLFPSQDYYNTLPLLAHLRIENTCPEPEQLSELRLSLITFIEILEFFDVNRREIYPLLANLLDPDEPIEAIDGQNNVPVSSAVSEAASGIREVIDKVLDDASQVRSSASKELSRIRTTISRLQGGVEKRMSQIFKEVRKSGWVDEGAEVTVREGRLVIPFRNTHKRKIQGVVHDESATGQTVYVEPVELFEMNNEIRELHHAENREITRILVEVADFIRPCISELTEINKLLGKIDFIRAKAQFALQVGGILCDHIVDRPHIRWFQAVHPLLFLSHSRVKKSVVPLNICLPAEERVLVISGPNAGGKSICLKTVGLLQYMLQCGILPPAREDSEFGVFGKIMIDIGDEQSLENDLSTYTSKLLNMKFFLEHLDGKSLFLIDEMGTGTDPSVGGAVAEASLVSMAKSGAFGVVTTHYSNLKLLAGREPGIANGAMLFDTGTMKPLFTLHPGKPGSSFAIEIATSIGFPQKELDHAAELIGGSQLDFERQLQDLEQEKEVVTKQSTELHVADEFLGELISKYEKMIAETERSKREILENAREEAHQLLKDSNKLIERTIKEIRESQADKEKTRNARSALESKRSELAPDPAREQEDRTSPDKAVLLSGQQERRRPSGISDIITDKQESFTLTLDLRGKRADEAFLEIQRFIDDAFLLSVKEVRILHGKGTGALREVTRNYLKGLKEIKGFRDEEMERGGSGVTVVTL